MKTLTHELYKKLFLIRCAEEKIRQEYPSDEIKTPTHLAIGEEAIAVGVIEATNPDNQIFGTYRNHGIYLAKTGETDGFFGELFGKETGLSHGKAGSMHIMNPEKGILGTSAIVGSTVPLAVGAAFANQYKSKKTITVVFFGDGAIDEGAFWESINFACLKKIPMIFVCEDNSYAIHSHATHRHGYESIAKIVKNYNCDVYESESTDVEELYHLTKNASETALKNSRPAFIYCKYYRYLEHVGINFDFQFGYREESEYKKWLEKDPIALQRKRLVEQSSESEVIELEETIRKQIEKSVTLARKAAFPKKEELLQHVFYE